MNSSSALHRGSILRAHDKNKNGIFVSHFNPDRSPQQTRIIEALQHTGLPFYDPTPLVENHRYMCTYLFGSQRHKS